MVLRYDVLLSALFLSGVLLALHQANDWRSSAASHEGAVVADALRGRSGVADSPSRQLQVCSDARGTAWCTKKKNKCSKSRTYQQCRLTCGRCTPAEEPTTDPPSTIAPEPTPGCSDTQPTPWCKQRESKCNKRRFYQQCLLTCGRCSTSAPVPVPSPPSDDPTPTSSTLKAPSPQPITSTTQPPAPPGAELPAPAPSDVPEPSPEEDDEAAPAPGPAPAAACRDAKPAKWCTDRAESCNKRWIYSKCRLSCGRCQTAAPTPEPTKAPDSLPPPSLPDPSRAPTAAPTFEQQTPSPTPVSETPQPTVAVVTLPPTPTPEPETPQPTEQVQAPQPTQEPQTPQPTEAQTPQPTSPPSATPEPTSSATPLPTPSAGVAGEVRRLAEEISWTIGNSTDLGHALGGVLRLAFHDAGTFDGSTGGADGCVDLDSAENGGLASVVDMLEPIVATAQTLSRADVWQLAANVALEYAGGPAIEFRTGRKQASSCQGHAALLPDAEQGHNHIRDVFVTRLQFTEREVTALMGAHVLGKLTATNSGYMGQWVPGNANTRFTNLYFRDMLRVRWNRRTRAPFFGMGRTEWRGPPNSETVMLNTDIEVAFDTSACNSAGGNGNCPRAQHAFSDSVTEFSNDQQLFFDTFRVAWTKMSALGAGPLTCALDDCSTPGPFATSPPPGGGNGGGGPGGPGGGPGGPGGGGPGGGGPGRRRGGGGGPGRR